MRWLLDLIAPPLCAICAASCAPAEDACPRCIAEIAAVPGGPFAVAGVERAWAATAYEGTGRRLVAQLKFGGRLRLARLAARAISGGMPPPPAAASIVPVPPDPLRQRMRGFDPAGRIATELARELALPLSRSLVRGHGPRQVGKPRAQRLASGPVVQLTEPPPHVAVLVDDVATTGTTLAACAEALRTGGCTDLLAVAFARA